MFRRFLRALRNLIGGILRLLTSTSRRERNDRPSRILSSVLSNLMLFIVWTPAVIGVGALIARQWWVGAIALSVAGTLLTIGLERIPEEPPHKGLLTFWGKRYPVVKEEGWTLLFPFFPLFYDVVREGGTAGFDVTKKNENFVFKDIRCKLEDDPSRPTEGPAQVRSGGSVEVGAAITWEPDPEELIQYGNAGGRSGVVSIIKDMLSEDLRQEGRSRTWEEMTFAVDRLSVKLINKLTGVTPESPVDDMGDDAVEEFIRSALKDGVADIWDLGIKIRRLNVERVDPEGELEHDAERAAREFQQRQAEEFETGTLSRIMQLLKREFPDLSDQEILNAVQAERGKAQRVIVDGSGDTLTKAAGLLRGGNRS